MKMKALNERLVMMAGLVVMLGLILPDQTALGCSCLGPLTIDSSLSRAETAVLVTIMEVLTPPNPNDQASSRYFRAYANKVVKGCKLTRYTEFYIKTAANSALCGVDFLQNSMRYILFGSVTSEAIPGRTTSAQSVLSIALCDAHTSLASIDATTLTSLRNKPDPVCSNSTPTAPSSPTSPVATSATTCWQKSDCYKTHGFNAVCISGKCAISTIAGPPPPAPTPVRPPVPVPVPVRPPAPVPVPVRPPAPVPTPVRPPAPTTSSTSTRINCSTCPNGYYDGCNTCTCTTNGQATCTEIGCATYGTPACRNIRPPPNPLPRPSIFNCYSCPNGYYDGCNTCGCNSDKSSSCTLRYCPVYGQAACSDIINPRPIGPNPAPAPSSSTTSSTPVINCNTCPNGYYDGCNTCGCNGSWTNFCTRQTCSVYGKAICSNVTTRPPPTPTASASLPVPTPVVPPIINCSTCPYGYYDGCNSCGCNGPTTSYCTQRYCFTLGTPVCNQPSTTSREGSIDCRTCPNGYFDGCNNCMCGTGDILGGCTKRACPNGNISPPQCN